MAKKTAKKVTKRDVDKPTPTVTTLDERDAGDTRTAAERRREAAKAQRDYENEKEQQNAEDFRNSDPISDNEIDVDKLPINHPTLMTARDKGLPPEATPREGKTSPAPPIAVPALSDREVREREGKRVLVEAIAPGYYDHIRRRPGDVFYIASETEFSKRWMRRAPKGAQPFVSSPNQAIRAHHDAVLQGKMGMGQTAGAGVTRGIDQAEEANPLDAD